MSCLRTRQSSLCTTGKTAENDGGSANASSKNIRALPSPLSPTPIIPHSYNPLDSYDHLAAYARNRMGKHLGTWLAWNADAKRFAGGQVPGVGIYHEAFLVSAGQYEAVYRNVPPYGLARLGRVVGAMEGRMRSAKGRLGRGDGGDHAEVEGSGGNGAVCPAAAACPVAAK